MRVLSVFVLLLAAATVAFGGTVQTISFDLSTLHPGSTLSGNFTLPDSPAVGTTAVANLTFSDPADYTPTSLTTTVTLGAGTWANFTVEFSPISFTNPSGNSNLQNIYLLWNGRAQCDSFPCTASGQFKDRDPAMFTATYTISPATNPGGVPEPGSAALVLIPLGAAALLRRRIARTGASR